MDQLRSRSITHQRLGSVLTEIDLSTHNKRGGTSSPPSKVNWNENLVTYFGLPRCDRRLAKADLAIFLPRLSEDCTRSQSGSRPGCGARPLRLFCRSAKCRRQTLLLESKSCPLETPSPPEQ